MSVLRRSIIMIDVFLRLSFASAANWSGLAVASGARVPLPVQRMDPGLDPRIQLIFLFRTRLDGWVRGSSSTFLSELDWTVESEETTRFSFQNLIGQLG